LLVKGKTWLLIVVNSASLVTKSFKVCFQLPRSHLSLYINLL